MTKLSRSLSVLSLALMGTALTGVSAQAAGFYLSEQSVKALGASYSGNATSINDASTIFFNPAGMTKLEGVQMHLGSHLLMPSASMENRGSTNPANIGGLISGPGGGNPYDPTLVPNGFISAQVNDNLWLGFGMTAPFGLAGEYESSWFGRYDSIKSELAVYDFQPTIAYKVNDMLSIAAGLDIQHARAELTNAVYAGATEGVSTLSGDDIATGFNVGLQFTPRPDTTIGLTYRSSPDHNLEGYASASGTTNADFNVNGTANLDLPAIAQFGIAHDVNDKWKIMGQATWFQWSNFKEISLVTSDRLTIAGLGVDVLAGGLLQNQTQGYEDSWNFALGAEYKYDENWTFRGGAQFDQTPTTDEHRSSRVPDADRFWLAGGATYNFNDRLSLDVAAAYLQFKDSSYNLHRNNTFSTAVQADFKAESEGSGPVFALGLNYKF